MPGDNRERYSAVVGLIAIIAATDTTGREQYYTYQKKAGNAFQK
jgi:hypothetical protein